MANVKFGSVMRFVVGCVVASHVGKATRKSPLNMKSGKNYLKAKKVNADKVAALCAMLAMASKMKVSGNQMDYYVSRMPYNPWEVA